MSMGIKGWQKSDWRAKPRVQMPDYPDSAALAGVEGTLSRMPPLVVAGDTVRVNAAASVSPSASPSQSPSPLARARRDHRSRQVGRRRWPWGR